MHFSALLLLLLSFRLVLYPSLRASSSFSFFLLFLLFLILFLLLFLHLLSFRLSYLPLTVSFFPFLLFLLPLLIPILIRLLLCLLFLFHLLLTQPSSLSPPSFFLLLFHHLTTHLDYCSHPFTLTWLRANPPTNQYTETQLLYRTLTLDLHANIHVCRGHMISRATENKEPCYIFVYCS